MPTAAEIEEDKKRLGIDELIFELAVSIGRPKTKASIRRELDPKIVREVKKLGE